MAIAAPMRSGEASAINTDAVTMSKNRLAIVRQLLPATGSTHTTGKPPSDRIVIRLVEMSRIPLVISTYRPSRVSARTS